MANQRNHHLLNGSLKIGDGELRDYGLYELGTYPGAIKMDGFVIYGEIYEVDEKTKRIIDELEDEGNLYSYKLVSINLNGKDKVVGFYEFIDDGNKYPIRKPIGKWNEIRNDVD